LFTAVIVAVEPSVTGVMEADWLAITGCVSA
jgi:hypothetical protein